MCTCRIYCSSACLSRIIELQSLLIPGHCDGVNSRRAVLPADATSDDIDEVANAT
jgi:hypothetical protein